jgi:hypothetical protein
MAVTLILTRNPLRTFAHGHQSGRWGQLIAVRGPRIRSVQLTAPGANPGNGRGPNPGNGVVSTGSITIDTGVLTLQMVERGTITETNQYTSMERFRTDDGNGYYVQLHPKPDPYWITFEYNTVVQGLRAGHDGRCFRVHGGRQGPEQGILIHEAPHVGWLIGCISPRPLGNVTVEFPNDDTNPSHQSMDELIQFVGVARADLFVLDW